MTGDKNHALAGDKDHALAGDKDHALAGDKDHALAGDKSSETMRRCIVSRKNYPKAAMIRFVIAPDGTATPDVQERLPGRGLWIKAERDMLLAACKVNAFAKAARAKVEVPADLTERVEARLARRGLDLIGLARRAGQLVAGFEKVSAWLGARPPETGGEDENEDRGPVGGVILAASDGAPGGRNKVRALARDWPEVAVFTAAELGAAIGREHTVHMIVLPGRIANKLRREAMRLEGIRV